MSAYDSPEAKRYRETLRARPRQASTPVTAELGHFTVAHHTERVQTAQETIHAEKAEASHPNTGKVGSDSYHGAPAHMSYARGAFDRKSDTDIARISNNSGSGGPRK